MEALTKLEGAARSYLAAKDAHRDISGRRSGWKKTQALIKAAIVSAEKSGLIWVLSDLWNASEQAAGFVAMGWFSAIGRKGRRSQEREELYDNVLRVWIGLGGKLSLSRSSTNSRVGGPLIKFLHAVLKPVLGGETPKEEGLASIIKRKRRVLINGVFVSKKID